MTEEGSGPGSLDLRQAAALLGMYCALERRLFELTGTLATHPDLAPEAQVFLDSVSGEHAWHAELWADRLPVVAGIDASALVTLPTPVDSALTELAGGSHRAQMAGLYRVVVPRLVATYARHRSQASDASERPTLRALHLVLRDQVEAWMSGEALVQGLVGSAEEAAEAAAAVAGVEARLVGTEWGVGLAPWPGRRA